MDYNEFVARVQSQARLKTGEAAVQAIRATLETLGSRLSDRVALDLAAHLPREIGEHLRRGSNDDLYAGEELDLNRFLQLVAKREGEPFLDAVFHARAVMEALLQAAPPEKVGDLRAELPKDYASLFQSWSGESMPSPRSQSNERRPNSPG